MRKDLLNDEGVQDSIIREAGNEFTSDFGYCVQAEILVEEQSRNIQQLTNIPPINHQKF